ncbi:hypothetical protein [Escherichia coli]|uniref:hypothetical protein n=1 Tax=Escherichia coli TaxID=562 RepID=UPI00388F44BC
MQLTPAIPLGITKASLATESFISAASFQRPSRADRSSRCGQTRRTARPERERYRGSSDPGRYRLRVPPDRMRRRAAGEAPGCAAGDCRRRICQPLAELLNAGLGGSDNE